MIKRFEHTLSSTIADNKRILRSEMLAKRNRLTELEIHSKSKQIQEIFTTSHFFEESNILGVYFSSWFRGQDPDDH